MKTLPELRTEIELGLAIYNTARPSDFVRYAFDRYSYNDGEDQVDFRTFDELVAGLLHTRQPIWITGKPQAHIDFEEMKRRESVQEDLP
jgi:hypothetical protein